MVRLQLSLLHNPIRILLKFPKFNFYVVSTSNVWDLLYPACIENCWNSSFECLTFHLRIRIRTKFLFLKLRGDHPWMVTINFWEGIISLCSRLQLFLPKVDNIPLYISDMLGRSETLTTNISWSANCTRSNLFPCSCVNIPLYYYYYYYYYTLIIRAC